MRFRYLLVRSLPLLIVSLPVGAEEVSLTPIKDNTLYEVSPFNLSNGAGDYIFSGNTVNRGLRRALVAFDIAAAIPEGATIQAVRLTLHMSMTIAGDQETALHRVTADWGEESSKATGEEGGGIAALPGDATWSHRFFDTDPWNEPGGDFVGGASAVTAVGDTGNYTWGSTPELVADVQSWLDEPLNNFGWAIIGNEAANTTAKRFNSREHSNQALRPVLTVEFAPANPVPATPTAGIAALALALLTAGVALLRRRAIFATRG